MLSIINWRSQHASGELLKSVEAINSFSLILISNDLMQLQRALIMHINILLHIQDHVLSRMHSFFKRRGLV